VTPDQIVGWLRRYARILESQGKWDHADRIEETANLLALLLARHNAVSTN
jgi:hypothetical protein